MFQGIKILFVSQASGFSSQVGVVIWQTAKLLKSQGAVLLGAFTEKGANSGKFEKLFDEIFPVDKLPGELPDLACIHHIQDLKYHFHFQKLFQERAALFVHDHSTYCPRESKRLPFSGRGCSRRYSRLACSCCGWLCNPSAYAGAAHAPSPFPYPIRTFNEKVTFFQDRLDLMRRYQNCVVPNCFMRDNLLANGFSPEFMHVIPFPLALDSAQATPAPSEPPRILLVCHPSRPRESRACIEALARLQRPFQLLVQTPEPSRPYLKRLIRQTQLEEKATFLEGRPEDASAPDAEIALVPLDAMEPYSLAVAECASRGMPVISSDSRGLQETLIAQETGFALDCQKADAIADALDKLLQSPELRQKMGASAQQLVRQNFSQEQFLRRFHKLM